LKEWITPDFQNMPSITNLEEEEIVDAPGDDGNASMPEQVKPPNPWKMMMRSCSSHVPSRVCHITVRFIGHSKIVDHHCETLISLFWHLEFRGCS